MKSCFASCYLSRRGLTLLETALALAVLGIVIAGVWALSGSAFGSGKKNRLSEQVVSIVETVRSYARNTDLAGPALNTRTLWDLGLLPSDINRGGTPGNPSFRNPYGGNLGVAVSASNLYITLSRVPSDACVDLVYSRLGGSTEAAENFGFIGYAPTTTMGPTSNNFSFDAVTQSCASSTDLLLAFRPQ